LGFAWGFGFASPVEGLGAAFFSALGGVGCDFFLGSILESLLELSDRAPRRDPLGIQSARCGDEILNEPKEPSNLCADREAGSASRTEAWIAALSFGHAPGIQLGYYRQRRDAPWPSPPLR
jgi:hypothetical protein